MANINDIQNGESGLSARNKINEAIAEANKVDDKQDADALGTAAFNNTGDFVGAGAVGSQNVTTATGTQTVVQALDQRGPAFDSVADMKAASGLTVGIKCRTLGYYEPGDGGGNDYEIVAAGTGTDDGGSFINLAGSGLQAKGLFVDGAMRGQQFGVFPGSGNNETTGIRAAIEFHFVQKMPLKFAAGNYLFDGITYTTAPFKADIEGVGGIARFIGTSALSADGRMFRFTTTDNIGTFTLAADVATGQRYFELTSVTGLSRGNMIRLTSTELWPYDNRGVYYRGETHYIDSVDTVNNRVYFTDRTRDNYTIAQIDNITAWIPNECRIKNIYADMQENGGAACYQISRCAFPEYENIYSEGVTGTGLWSIEAWQMRGKNIHAYDIGKGVGGGYGVQDRGGVGTSIDGLTTVGCRRSFDAESLSGVNSSPARDYSVVNFSIRGGGSYWPDTTETSYGIGNHGPSENGRFSNGSIYDCRLMVNHRGLKLDFNDVTGYGICFTPVDLTYGSGFAANNVWYYPADHPNTGVALSGLDNDDLPEAFARFGRASTTDADWNFDLPVTFNNCGIVGAKDAFLSFENATQKIRNIHCNGNTTHPAVDPALGDFYFVRHLSTLAASNFSNNPVDIQERNYNFCNSLIGERDGVDDAYAVTIDGKIIARVIDDDFCRFGKIGYYENSRPLVAFCADAGGRQLFEIRPNNGTLSVEGSSTLSTLDGTATPLSLDGTFGIDGNYTTGMDEYGELYIENRTGQPRSIRIGVVA